MRQALGGACVRGILDFPIRWPKFCCNEPIRATLILLRSARTPKTLRLTFYISPPIRNCAEVAEMS